MPHSHCSVHIKFCKLFKKAGALCLKAQAVYELVIRGIIMHLKLKKQEKKRIVQMAIANVTMMPLFHKQK